MGVLLHPFKGGGGFKIFFEEGGVGSVEVEGASGVVFAEAGSGKDVEDVWIGYTFFSFGINELLLAGDGTKGGDENECDPVLIGSVFHFLPCRIRGGSGLEGFILFLKGDELGGFGLGRRGDHFCFGVLSGMVAGG